MKAILEQKPVERHGVQRQTECGMVVNAKAFEMLARQYSDPIKAILQEIGANAADSHIRAAKSHSPFKVKLPNSLDDHLRIRDFGIGMSKDVIYDVYINYMKSDKTQTNEETGFFGIGSKTPLAYTDSFNITTYNDGTMSMYSLGYNERGIPELNEFGDYSTEEPNGVEVSFSVKPDDFNKFADAAEKVYSFFETRPAVTGNGRCSFKSIDKILEGDDWYLRAVGWSDSAIVIMGNIAYPVDHDHFEGKHSDILNSGFVGKVPMASVNITPSREALEYTNLTINSIKSAIDKAIPEIEKHTQEQMDECKSYWSATLKSKSIRRHLGWRLSNSLKALGSWRGTSIDHYKSHQLDTLKRYELENDRVRARTMHDTSTVPVHKSTKIVVKDIDSKFDSRCRHYCYENNKSVYLVDETSVQEVMDKVGCIEADEVVLLASELPDPPKTSRTFRSGPRKKTVTVLSRVPNESYEGKQAWTEEEIDPTATECLYVSIKNYECFDEEGSLNVGRILGQLKAIGIEAPEIYGIKKPQLNRVKKLNNWTCLRYWVLEHIRDKMADPSFVEKLKNSKAIDQVRDVEEYKTIFDKAGDRIKDKEGLFYKFASYCSENGSQGKHEDAECFIRLCSHVEFPIKGIDNSQIEDTIRKVEKKYYLVTKFVCRYSSYYFQSDSYTHYTDSVIDTVNAIDSFKEN